MAKMEDLPGLEPTPFALKAAVVLGAVMLAGYSLALIGRAAGAL